MALMVLCGSKAQIQRPSFWRVAVEDLAVESVGRVAASRFLTRSLSGLSPVWNLKAADPTFGGS